ncbi:MAG: hypothetical protein AAGN66_21280 [Acidobacteriota bacterium]
MKSTKLPSWIERLAGLDPVPAPPHVFALGPTSLRYGAFFRSPQGFAFDAEQSAELPPDAFVPGVLGGPLRDPSVLQELIGEVQGRLEEPVTEASLVLPDTWLRLTFSELAELPKKASVRQEMLSWKLKRLVPFRVEDLRISATQVTPFPSQEEPLRLMIGFAAEALVSQLEETFEAAGVRLGRITNTSLPMMASLENAVQPADLAALVAVFDDAYTVSFFRDGEPLIYRYKAFADGGVHGDAVLRDLRMTASFVHQHFPQQRLERAFLAAPDSSSELWQRWIYDELAITPEPLSFEHFELTRGRAGTSWLDTAPLLGAASIEVS